MLGGRLFPGGLPWDKPCSGILGRGGVLSISALLICVSLLGAPSPPLPPAILGSQQLPQAGVHPCWEEPGPRTQGCLGQTHSALLKVLCPPAVLQVMCSGCPAAGAGSSLPTAGSWASSSATTSPAGPAARLPGRGSGGCAQRDKAPGPLAVQGRLPQGAPALGGVQCVEETPSPARGLLSPAPAPHPPTSGLTAGPRSWKTQLDHCPRETSAARLACLPPQGRAQWMVVAASLLVLTLTPC